MISSKVSVAVWKSLIFSTVLSLVAVSSASADVFNTLHNTGVDNSGNLLADQAVDSHYELVTSADPTYAGPNTFATQSIPSPPWVANGPNSRWITPRPDNTVVAAGQYVYRLEFDVPGLLLGTASINGSFATDDGGQIFLNGVDKGISSGGFGGLTPFTINGDFVQGTNTLDFVVNNGGLNPSGLRVDGLGGSATAATVNLSTAYNQNTSSTLAHGNLDDNWVLTSAPAGVTLGPAKSIAKNPAWFGHDPDARWISAQNADNGSSNIPAGDYTYAYSFNLNRTGKLFEVAGNLGSDDFVNEVRVNGTTVLTNIGGFGGPSDLGSIIDQTLFVDGLNTIEVIINNGGAGPNPHGFQLSAFLNDEGLSAAPIADGDGPYTIDLAGADPLNLDALGSLDTDVALGDSIVLYEWDLDNNGLFDFTTTSAILSLTQAQYSPFLNTFGDHNIVLRVTDATGLTGTDLATVSVVPEPSSLLLALIGAVACSGYYGRRRRC